MRLDLILMIRNIYISYNLNLLKKKSIAASKVLSLKISFHGTCHFIIMDDVGITVRNPSRKVNHPSKVI